jgi:NTE family protein
MVRTIAVVLAGAVAKGAFEAGVIQALARTDVKIARIVGASSGALNGTVLASAVRARNLVAGAEVLAGLWRDRAEWHEVFHASLRDIVKLDGLSDQQRLLGLLRDHVPPSQPAEPDPVNLRLIVAALHGYPGEIGERPATTFEAICDFHGDDFGSRAGLDRVFSAAVASAAFPVMFAPVEVPGVGPCVDGGLVNNTPMKWALDGKIGTEIDAIVVISTSVEHRTVPPGELKALSLVGHLADMLIEERLYRDLREAEQTNASLGRLDQLVRQGALGAAQLDAVKDAIGWSKRRVVDIIPIRPTRELPGNAFAGFLNDEYRREYLDAGYLRALEVLGGRGWSLRRTDAAPVWRADAGVAADPIAAPRPVERDRAD